MKREMIRRERDWDLIREKREEIRECDKNWATEEGRKYIKDKLEWERCRKK